MHIRIKKDLIILKTGNEVILENREVKKTDLYTPVK